MITPCPASVMPSHTIAPTIRKWPAPHSRAHTPPKATKGHLISPGTPSPGRAHNDIAPDLGLFLSKNVGLSDLFYCSLWASLIFPSLGMECSEDWHGSSPILLPQNVVLDLAPHSRICQTNNKWSLSLSFLVTELWLVWPNEVLGQLIWPSVEMFLCSPARAMPSLHP